MVAIFWLRSPAPRPSSPLRLFRSGVCHNNSDSRWQIGATSVASYNPDHPFTSLGRDQCEQAFTYVRLIGRRVPFRESRSNQEGARDSAEDHVSTLSGH